MPNKVGKRYVCTECGNEIIITRAGQGEIICCGKPMEEKK